MIKKFGQEVCTNLKHLWTSVTHRGEFCLNCHYEGKECVK